VTPGRRGKVAPRPRTASTPAAAASVPRQRFVRACLGQPSTGAGAPVEGAEGELLLGTEASVAANRSCGFAALLGPSNSGKSTLLNLLVGSKVAIVTPKVQTTRCRVAGIVAKDSTMIIYMDTPGVFKPSGRLDRAMVRAAWGAASSGDVVAIIVDSAQVFHGGRRLREEGDEVYVSEALQEVFARVPNGRLEYCICLNKIDSVEPADRREFEACFRRALDKMGIDGSAATIFPMSARDATGVDEFTAWVRSRMPSGPWLYPEDDLTDMPMRLLAAEVTREKVFMLLKQELPYEIAIETTSYKDNPDGSVRITQDILVNRSSQKRIVTGQGGSMVKAIGVAARQDLSKMMDGVVHLMLTVKVREKWKEDSRSYKAWGLDYNA
jgi:GTPase